MWPDWRKTNVPGIILQTNHLIGSRPFSKIFKKTYIHIYKKTVFILDIGLYRKIYGVLVEFKRSLNCNCLRIYFMIMSTNFTCFGLQTSLAFLKDDDRGLASFASLHLTVVKWKTFTFNLKHTRPIVASCTSSNLLSRFTNPSNCLASRTSCIQLKFKFISWRDFMIPG